MLDDVEYLGKNIKGNSHYQGEKTLHQLICAAVCGTWWTGMKDELDKPIADQRDGTPNGFHIIRFEGNKYRETFKAAKFGTDFQLRLSCPIGKIAKDEIEPMMVVVNVFDSSEKSVVKCQIGGLGFQIMQKTLMKDPFYEQIYERMKDHVAS